MRRAVDGGVNFIDLADVYSRAGVATRAAAVAIALARARGRSGSAPGYREWGTAIELMSCLVEKLSR